MPKVTEEHVEARRRQILSAALRCFAREGFHRATMQDICRQAELPHLHVVGASAGATALPPRLGEAVAGKPPDRGSGSNEDASTVLASDQALTLEHVHRLACSHPRHAVGLRKGGLTRQRVALAISTLTDRLPELVCDLPIDGSVARRVDRLGHFGAGS